MNRLWSFGQPGPVQNDMKQIGQFREYMVLSIQSMFIPGQGWPVSLSMTLCQQALSAWSSDHRFSAFCWWSRTENVRRLWLHMPVSNSLPWNSCKFMESKDATSAFLVHGSTMQPLIHYVICIVPDSKNSEGSRYRVQSGYLLGNTFLMIFWSLRVPYSWQWLTKINTIVSDGSVEVIRPIWAPMDERRTLEIKSVMHPCLIHSNFTNVTMGYAAESRSHD